MKGLLLRLTMSLLLANLAGIAFSQDDTMKTLPPVVIYSRTNVDKAVTKSFDKTFKDAVNEQWFRMDKNYLVTFISGETKNNALFRKNGSLIYHISWGTEQNLPSKIKVQIQNAYSDYNIVTAINVRANERNIWLVNLEGLKKFIIVSAEEGELQEVRNYVKPS